MVPIASISSKNAKSAREGANVVECYMQQRIIVLGNYTPLMHKILDLPWSFPYLKCSRSEETVNRKTTTDTFSYVSGASVGRTHRHTHA